MSEAILRPFSGDGQAHGASQTSLFGRLARNGAEVLGFVGGEAPTRGQARRPGNVLDVPAHENLRLAAGVERAALQAGAAASPGTLAERWPVPMLAMSCCVWILIRARRRS
jgi:hypothetical protein